MQLCLFEPVPTVPSPICFYEHCQRNGQAVLGPVRQVSQHCTTRSITCLKCGATGVKATNEEPR